MFCAVYFRNLLFVAKIIPWFSKTWNNPQGFFFFLIGHVAFGHARPAVAPLGVRFAHPVRLPPDTHSQGHGRPCLQSRHRRPGFTACGLLHVYVLTAGRGHASFLEMLIFNEL